MRRATAMSVFDRIRTWAPFGAVPEIRAEELHAALAGADPPVLVDVRTRTEWEQSHIEGAIPAPIVRFEAELDRLAIDPARPVVVICLSAHRSIPAVRVLRARGFQAAAQLEGGMLAWWRRRYPCVRAEP